MRYAIAILLGLLPLGCASTPRPVLSTPPVDLGPADALFDAGCYTCLKDAFDAYDRALAGSAPVPSGTRAKAFETAVLLALREKELGLPAQPWLDRASALATEADQRYLDVASRIPWASAGTAVDFSPPGPLQPAMLKQWIAAMPSDDHPVLEQYLFVALSCTFGRLVLTPETESRIDTTHPAVRYRIGLCGTSDRPHLEAVVAADPRFVEAWFFIGRYEMTAGVNVLGGPLPAAGRSWLVRAVPPLLTAHDGIPESPNVTIALAGLMRSRTELNRALGLYDEALAIRPTQGDGLLGKLVTLSYLTRHDEAIATASHMIDLGVWHVGSAYYWRAWNRYQQKQLDASAADVASARTLILTDDVLTLAGMIAYDQTRPADARADFARALSMNSDNCVARWYLGLLAIDEEAWVPAIERFSAAGLCYERAVEQMRAGIALLPEDLPQDARDAQMKTINDNMTTSLLQAGRSFFNAAQASMRIGDRDGARVNAQLAAGYENMKERAEALLQSLDRN